jgi:hydroxyacylglutathione hydrolase
VTNDRTAPQLITIQLPLVNAFLVRGERTVLVDAGAPGDGPAILRAAERAGVRPRDIGLIFLTHGHVDHFGAAALLREATGAPVAVHRDDAPNLLAGRNPELPPADWEGRLFRPFLPWSAAPLEPDLTFDEAFDLRAYGVDAAVIPAPGHSPGSIALLLAGGELIAGDLLRGGFMGGRLRGGYPNPPFFVSDRAALRASVDHALTLPLTRIFVGHGGPLDPHAVRRRLAAGLLGSAHSPTASAASAKR